MYLNKKLMSGIILMLSFILLSISSVSATDTTLGTYKQDSCVELIQTCADCNYVNLSSVKYPNSSVAESDIGMDKNGNEFTYTFCNTSILGKYIVSGYGDVDGTDTIFVYDFEVTPSGSSDISSGAGLTYIASLIVIVLISGFFFIMSTRVNSPTFKISFIVISSIILIMAVFYSMVAVQQNLGGFENIISGYSTFFTVLKIMASVSVLALLVVALLISIRFYKFKRGLID